jgi:hypothetical protein
LLISKEIFGPNEDGVIEKWRNLHNDKLYLSCSWSQILREIYHYVEVSTAR